MTNLLLDGLFCKLQSQPVRFTKRLPTVFLSASLQLSPATNTSNTDCIKLKERGSSFSSRLSNCGIASAEGNYCSKVTKAKRYLQKNVNSMPIGFIDHTSIDSLSKSRPIALWPTVLSFYLKCNNHVLSEHKNVRSSNGSTYVGKSSVFSAWFVRNHNFHNTSYVRHYSSGKHHQQGNLYEILELTPKATQSQIKSAYYRLSQIHHPDKQGERKEHKQFLDITAAYEVLGNIRKRRLYDRGILNPQLHDVDGDYTKDQQHHTPHTPFREREGFKRRHGAPRTGRTSIYNFDEFYKQHYPESVNRKRKDQQFDIDEAKRKAAEKHETITGSVLAFTFFVFFFYFISFGIK